MKITCCHRVHLAVETRADLVLVLVLVQLPIQGGGILALLTSVVLAGFEFGI